MDRGKTFTIATALTLVVYVLSYALHLILAGTFALPPAVLAVLLPFAPVIDYVAAYLIHGFSTGDWSMPTPFPPPPAKPRPTPPPSPTPPAA